VLQRLLILWMVLIAMSVAVMPIDSRWGLSLLWGFSVCLLPAVCFTWYAFRYRGARVVIASVKMFYRAETVKFFLTAILFAVVFHHADKISTAVFFLAFVAAQIASWLVSAMTIKPGSGK
jgi:F0F1-type ATP synthase assembly protein I